VEGSWVSGLSVLAMIPTLEPDPDLVPPQAFHSLYTNIRLLSLVNHGPATRILVTSVNAGEGKSYAAANLAAVIAQAGHRVLLLDAHPWRPVQHGRFHLQREPGLTNLLESMADKDGPTVDPAGFVQPTAVAGLELLTAGRPVEDWTGYLPAFHKLVNQLTGRYEYLVLDGPPLMDDTLAAALAELSNGMFLIIDTAITRRSQLSAALASYSLKAKCIGVVLNRMVMEQTADIPAFGQDQDAQYVAAVRSPARPPFERPVEIEEIAEPPAQANLNGTAHPHVEERVPAVVAENGRAAGPAAGPAAVETAPHLGPPGQTATAEQDDRLEELAGKLRAARKQMAAQETTIEQLRSERDTAWSQLESAIRVRQERDAVQQRLSTTEQHLSEMTAAFEQLWQEAAAFQEQLLWQAASQKSLLADLAQVRQSADGLAGQLEQALAEQSAPEARHNREMQTHLESADGLAGQLEQALAEQGAAEARHNREMQTQLELAGHYQAMIAELKETLQNRDEGLARRAEQLTQVRIELAERESQLAQDQQHYQEAAVRYQDTVAGLTSQLAAARSELAVQTAQVVSLRADLKNKIRIIMACERKSGDLTRLLVDAGRRVEQSSSAARQEMDQKARLWKLAGEQIRRLEQELARARLPVEMDLEPEE
jgi:Mrp family chromosome partitioning ATPase